MASQFPRQAKMTAIVLQASINRSGLVADALFPKVRTPCFFQYVDWTNGANLKLVADAVGCKTDVKEIDPDAFAYVQKKTQDRALEISMGECCLTSCGDSVDLAALAEREKTELLTNMLLVGREKRAVEMATDESKYTARGSSVDPVAPDGVLSNEGALYFLPKTSVADANFKLLQWFMPIQVNNHLTGVRTVAVMSQNTLNKLLVHPTFIGAGCMVNATTTKEAVAALLNVREIVIADAAYQSGSSSAWVPLWNDDYILFTASHKFLTSEQGRPSFGISAHSREWGTFYRIDEKKGPTGGVAMQKQSHDETEVVLTYKAATLVKLV